MADEHTQIIENTRVFGDFGRKRSSNAFKDPSRIRAESPPSCEISDIDDTQFETPEKTTCNKLVRRRHKRTPSREDKARIQELARLGYYGSLGTMDYCEKAPQVMFNWALTISLIVMVAAFSVLGFQMY